MAPTPPAPADFLGQKHAHQVATRKLQEDVAIMSASTKAMQKQVEETQVRAATEIQVGPPRSNTNSRFPACPSVSPPALPAVATCFAVHSSTNLCRSRLAHCPQPTHRAPARR